MKSLLKYLSPFAPDQSGAVSALFEFGGLIVICDAGGCTGNICGFDEPRWFTRKSALFSAGLRDMDAILGRDEKLVEKLQKAAAGSPLNFAALIGTPVPAIIATDFRAIRRMAERRTGLPVLTLETTGTRLYDRGEESAWLALFRQFAQKKLTPVPGTVGVLGASPLECSRDNGTPLIRELENQGWHLVFCHGFGSGLDEVRKASAAEKNLVVSPAGVRTAEYLQQAFGTPWEVWSPPLNPALQEKLRTLSARKILVVHQQFTANAVRREIRKNSSVEIVAASWFMMLDPWKEANDVQLTDEAQFAELVQQGGFDAVIGDLKLKRVLRNFSGEFIDLPHFAVSGRLEE